MKAFITFLPFLFLACAHKPNMALTTPQGSVEEATDVTEETIDRSGVRLAVRAALPEFKSCYDVTLAQDKNLTDGKINLAWQIRENGIVHYAQVNEEQSTIHHPKLESCMLGVLQKIKMPEPPAGTVAEVVGYPFVFDKGSVQK